MGQIIGRRRKKRLDRHEWYRACAIMLSEGAACSSIFRNETFLPTFLWYGSAGELGFIAMDLNE